MPSVQPGAHGGRSFQSHSQTTGKPDSGTDCFRVSVEFFSEPYLKTFHCAFFSSSFVQWESNRKGDIFFCSSDKETWDKKFAYESHQVHWWAHLALLSNTPQPCNLASTRTPWDPEPTKVACPHRPKALSLRPSLPSLSTEHRQLPFHSPLSFAISSLILCLVPLTSCLHPRPLWSVPMYL